MEATHQPLLQVHTYSLSLRFFLKDQLVSPLLEDWYSRFLLVPLLPFTLLFIQQVYIEAASAAAAKSLQLCPTLCDPIDGSAPGSSVPGILQTRTLEWVAISFSNA